jgi:hypothetical protein
MSREWHSEPMALCPYRPPRRSTDRAVSISIAPMLPGSERRGGRDQKPDTEVSAS